MSWPLPVAEGSPGQLQQTGNGGPPARRGEPELRQRLPQEAWGWQPALRKLPPTSCCYPRAPSWLKQSLKAGSCLPGQRGRLSINPFYFCSVLPNHFKFSLFQMWDIIVCTQIQCGFLSLKALPLGRSPSQLWPVQSLATTSPLPSPGVIQFTWPQNYLGCLTNLKSTILCASFSSIPENAYCLQASVFLMHYWAKHESQHVPFGISLEIHSGYRRWAVFVMWRATSY